MKPVVAIIGRPNVGKSTLFNRLSDRKKAIVIDQPGATRDRNYTDCTWEGKTFTLIDTGGFEPASKEEILMQMREQTNLAVEEADCIIFLMDGKEGLMPADREIAKRLRAVTKPVFYIVNKIDGPKHEDFVNDFYQLGIEPLYSVSAQHGLGMSEFMNDLVDGLPESATAEEVEEAADDVIKIAVIGRPNVGKSSLLNKILGYERTIVNPLPGTTRDSIDSAFTLKGRNYLLVDTAGIRRKSRISLTLEKFSIVQAMKTVDRCDVALLVIDAEEGITEQDVKIAGLAFEKGTACIIVVNKWDKVEKDDRTSGTYAKDIKDKLKFMDFTPIIFVSALSGQRVLRIFEFVEAVYGQYTKRINTGELNREVAEFLKANPPPQYRNRSNPVNYATQVAIKPPTFIMFVGDPQKIHFSYERYLINQLREAFGFDHVPIRLFFRKKRK
ncbi:MAG: ribosome biogenesis GTPase Der [Deltaproteobacteria bacterium]|nr:ribosome biogenesis GTPase Der [Deltaproteobacteria bacterium]